MEKKIVKRIGIAFTIPEDLRRKFKVKTAQEDKRMSDVLRTLILEYVVKD